MLIILGGRGEKEQKEEERLGEEIEKEGGKRSVQFAHYVELYKACTFYI